MKHLFAIFLISVFISPSYAQVDKDSLDLSVSSYKSRVLNNLVDKQLNTYNFTSQLKYNQTFGNLFLGIKETFNSTITKTTSNNIKDEQYLKLYSIYSISDEIKTGFYLNNYMYSDDRSLAINKVSNTNTSLFIKINPLKNFEITPFGGFSNNNQINESNNGYLYGAEANLNNFELGDLDLSSIMRLQNEDISPRKNTLRFLNLNLNSAFENNLRNTISAYYLNQRKDFYFTADESTASEFQITNNIQSRLESNYFIEDKIKFEPENSHFSFDVHGRVAWRDIERTTRYVSLTNISSTAFDSRINESKIELLSSANYYTEAIDLSFKLSFTERDEKHSPRKLDGLNPIIYSDRVNSEHQKNNTSQLTTLAVTGLLDITRKDKLTFSVFHRKLKYDTPSEQNYDDRDELLSIVRILYDRQINPYLNIFLNIEGSINKIAYIFSERSSNNNIQRILKFSSGGNILLSRLQTRNSAEVSANYTVFDYEDFNPNYRSYSFRQLVVRDSSSYKISKKFSIFFTGYIKLSEQGDFKWSNFSSKPLRFVDERYIEPKIIFRLNEFSAAIGLRSFSLSNFNLKNGKQKEKISDYISTGPLLEINYDITDAISLRTYGWYEFITNENDIRREMANFNMKLLYKL